MSTNSVFRAVKNKPQAMNIRSLRRRIDFYLKQADLKRPGLSAHSLRRTSATLAMEAGIGLLELQIHLDHASPNTTAAYIARQERLKGKAAQSISIKI